MVGFFTQDERIGFDNQLSAIERTLKAKARGRFSRVFPPLGGIFDARDDEFFHSRYIARE